MSESGSAYEKLNYQHDREVRLQSAIREGIMVPVVARGIANTVSYVHPDVTLGTQDFVVGQPTKLACQLQKGGILSEPSRMVYIRPMHRRSAIVTGNADITYRGQKFNYLDSIGVGLISDNITGIQKEETNKLATTMILRPSSPNNYDPEKTWGLATKSWMQTDIQRVELFDQLGIRTIPIIAMTDLHEIEDENGELIPIPEAKKKGLIAQNTTPVEAFRSWVTPYRLQEVAYNRKDYEGVTFPQQEHMRRRAIFLAAFKDMQEDTSIPQEVRTAISSEPNIDTYLEWFTETLGYNVGKMHANQLSHGFLTELHNITLDARIVDLDSVQEKARYGSIATDRESLLANYQDFYKNFLVGMPQYFPMEQSPDYYLRRTREAYEKGLESLAG